jgi:transposase
MRWAGRRVAVYAHGAPTDMRKGFDSLCGMVTERLAALWRDEAAGPMTLTVSELDLFLDGSTLVGRMPLTPPTLPQFSLASDRR